MANRAMQKYRQYSICKTTRRAGYSVTWVYAAVLTVYVFAQSVFDVGLPDFIGTVLFFAAIVSVQKEDMFCILAFILPFVNAFGINELALVFFVVYIFRFGFFSANLARSILPLLILLAIELSHTIEYGGLIEFCRYAIFLILVMVFDIHYRSDVSPDAVPRCLLMFCTGAVASMTMLVVSSATVFGWDTLLSGELRIGYSYAESSSMLISMNANQVALSCAVTIAVLLLLFEKKSIAPIPFAIMLLDQIFVGVLSESRTFVLVLVFIILYYILANSKKGAQRRKILIMVLIFGVLIYWLSQTVLSGVVETITERFNSADMITGNNRTAIMQNNWEMATASPLKFLLGYGITTYDTLANGSAHNAIMEMLVGCGAVGMITCLFWLSKVFIDIFKKSDRKSRTATNLLPLITFILFTQTIQFLSQYYSILIFLFMIVAVQMAPKNLSRHDGLMKGEIRKEKMVT